VGTALVQVEGRTVGRAPVLTGKKVPAIGFVDRVFGGVGTLTLILVATVLLVVACSLLLAMGRRRRRQHA